MKRVLTITALSTLLAASLTGCNPLGGKTNSITDYFKVSTRETSADGTVTLTEFELDDKGALIGQTQKSNGKYVYKIADFTYDTAVGTKTSFRTEYESDGTTEVARYKLVSTYGLRYGNKLLETKYEEFLLTGENADETSPARHTVTQYNAAGLPSDSKDFENGEMVLWHKDFEYYTTNYSYTEVKGDVTKRIHYRTTSEGGYEIFTDWNGSTGILIEMVDNMDSTETTVSYDRYDGYDSEGENPVKTSVVETYEKITIEL